MLKRSLFIVVAVFVFFCSRLAFCETGYNANFLLGVLFKTAEMRNRAIAEIQKVDEEIARNDDTIRKSENIISITQQRTDSKARQAETLARQALLNAQEAKRKNEEIKMAWARYKIRIDESYTTISNMLAQNLGSAKPIKGFVSNYSGKVEILKSNGDRISLENGFLEPGDQVWTFDGTAEIRMLDGRTTVQLGGYSEFAIKKDTLQEQIAELVKGKVYMALDKLDDYEKKMKENIEKYKSDLKTIMQWTDEQTDGYLSKFLSKLRYGQERHGTLIVTPTAVTSARGTQYAINVKDANTTEITVLEGSVEVRNLRGDKKIMVNEGYGTIATKDHILKPYKIKDMDMWWER